jgi:hypothetical protein
MAVDAPPIARERASVQLGALIATQMASLIAFLFAPICTSGRTRRAIASQMASLIASLTASLIAPLIAEQLASALRANSARVLDLFRSWDADGDGQVIATDCYG